MGRAPLSFEGRHIVVDGVDAELELGGPRVGHPTFGHSRVGRPRVASRRVPPAVLANATIVFSAREVTHPFLQATSCLIVDATSSRVIQETSVAPMGFGSNSPVLTMRKCCGR